MYKTKKEKKEDRKALIEVIGWLLIIAISLFFVYLFSII